MDRKQAEFAPSKHYLTRIGRLVEQPGWPRRDCNLYVGLLYAEKRIQTIREDKILLLNISEGGAYAYSRIQNPPIYFHIFFGEYQYFISCYLVEYKNNNMHICFLREQPTDFIDILSRLTDPFEFRKQLRLSLYGLPDREISEKPSDRVTGVGTDQT